MAAEDQLKILAEELKTLSPEELDRRIKDYLSMDKEVSEVYCQEYARRGLELPVSDMMDH